MSDHSLVNKILLSVEATFLWLQFSHVDLLVRFFSACLVGISTFMIIVINWEKFIEKSKKIIQKFKK